MNVIYNLYIIIFFQGEALCITLITVTFPSLDMNLTATDMYLVRSEAIYPENWLADLYKVSPFSSFPATLNRCNRVLLSNLQTGAWKKKKKKKKLILGPKIVIKARNDLQIFWTAFLSGLRNRLNFLFQWGFTFEFPVCVMNFHYFLLCDVNFFITVKFPIWNMNFLYF